MTFGEANASRTYVSSTALVHRWPTGTAAVGLGLGAALGGPNFSFRKGELAFRTDYAMLREKAPLLVGFAVSLVACVGLWAYASLKQLERNPTGCGFSSSVNRRRCLKNRKPTATKCRQSSAASIQDKAQGQSIPQVSALDLVEHFGGSLRRAMPQATRNSMSSSCTFGPKDRHQSDLCISTSMSMIWRPTWAKFPASAKSKGQSVDVKNTGRRKTGRSKAVFTGIETTCP